MLVQYNCGCIGFRPDKEFSEAVIVGLCETCKEKDGSGRAFTVKGVAHKTYEPLGKSHSHQWCENMNHYLRIADDTETFRRLARKLFF